MPIYEFECRKCNERFEILISLSRINEARCPNCSSDNIERVMSTFSAKVSGGSSHSHGDGGCAGCASGQCATCGGH